MPKLVAISGYFDPLHVGHIDYIRGARKLGDYLIVLLDPDSCAMRKKGYVFMPEMERKKILESIKWVDYVVISEDRGRLTTPNAIRKSKPDIYANGGDKSVLNTKEEHKVCVDKGIEHILGVGGIKVQASSELIKRAYDQISSSKT
jgi:cytidyltransferase-like protein